MGNAADEKEVRRAQREARERRDRELEDVRALMATDEGRRFMARLLRITRVLHDSFTGNSTTFYNEGRRAVGSTVMADISRADPDGFVRLLKDEIEREDRNNG